MHADQPREMGAKVEPPGPTKGYEHTQLSETE